MIYLKWTSEELATLREDALYTEIDADGWVQREVAVTPDGSVSHQAAPSLEQPGWFGLARLSMLMLESNITAGEFERIWRLGDLAETSAPAQ